MLRETYGTWDSGYQFNMSSHKFNDGAAETAAGGPAGGASGEWRGCAGGRRGRKGVGRSGACSWVLAAYRAGCPTPAYLTRAGMPVQVLTQAPTRTSACEHTSAGPMAICSDVLSGSRAVPSRNVSSQLLTLG
eukprot:3907625-Prymnesium_polylepis.1